MFHLAGFYANRDGGDVESFIPAVQDQAIFTNGNDVRVPTELPFLIGEVAMSASTVTPNGVVESPSLRMTANVNITPFVNAFKLSTYSKGILHPLNPIPLQGDEAVNVALTTDSVAAVLHHAFLWFSDGVQQPVQGEIYTIRAVGAASLAAGVWVNTNIVFEQILPVGNYQIVGFRPEGSNLVGARLVFVGGQWRPGVLAGNTSNDSDQDFTRHGGMGVYGEFNTNTPPTVDCLGTVDTAQSFVFDVIKIS